MATPIQVWSVPLQVLEDTVETYFRCLSGDERSRADRFRFPDDRRRYIVARGTLRYLLGKQFDRPPQTIEFCYGEYGKPSVVLDNDGSCNFHFNVSHSGELALCALGRRHRVGIDIEKLKPIQRLDSMMERCLSEEELAQVENETNLTRAFLQRWTCKEAYLKAIGVGLSQSMKTIEVETMPLRLVCVPEDCENGWYLHSINVPDEYVSALVVEGESSVTLSCWQHELIGEND